MNLSIIIPTFNEGKTIKQLLQRVNKVNLHVARKEIIAVNDGSTDSTSKKLNDLRLKIQNFKIFNHSKNQGKGAAVNTGIKNSTGDYIIIQDADLEYNPNDIEKLVSIINEKKAEVAYGTRLKRLPDLKKDERQLLFLLHYFGNRFLSLLTSILYGQWITDMETCYKLFPKKALDGIRLKSKRFDFEPEITARLLKMGYHIVEVPIKTQPRGYKEGKKLNTIKDGVVAFLTLLKYRFVN